MSFIPSLCYLWHLEHKMPLILLIIRLYWIFIYLIVHFMPSKHLYPQPFLYIHRYFWYCLNLYIIIRDGHFVLIFAYTVYVKSFEAEKFRRFRRWPLNYETFPPKLLLHIHMCKVSKDSLQNFSSESSLTR